MHRHRNVGAICALLLFLTFPQRAAAQPDTQLWSEITLTWIKDHRVTLGVDLEPKVLVSAPADKPGWGTLDVTPSIECARGQWFDVLGEMLVGRTWQTDDLSSTEVTPRVGFRLHILSNLRNALEKRSGPGAASSSEICFASNGATFITRLTSPTRRPHVFVTGSSSCTR